MPCTARGGHDDGDGHDGCYSAARSSVRPCHCRCHHRSSHCRCQTKSRRCQSVRGGGQPGALGDRLGWRRHEGGGHRNGLARRWSLGSSRAHKRQAPWRAATARQSSWCRFFLSPSFFLSSVLCPPPKRQNKKAKNPHTHTDRQTRKGAREYRARHAGGSVSYFCCWRTFLPAHARALTPLLFPTSNESKKKA